MLKLSQRIEELFFKKFEDPDNFSIQDNAELQIMLTYLDNIHNMIQDLKDKK